MQEHDLPVVFGRGQMHVGRLSVTLGQSGELKVVGGKQGERAVMLHQALGNRTC